MNCMISTNGDIDDSTPTQPSRAGFARLALVLVVGRLAWCGVAGSVSSGAEPLSLLQQQAVQQAVAAAERSVVQIQTVGGIDVVGDTLTGAGPTTGIVVRSDGYILTSQFNFLSNPSSVLVTLADERRLPARIIAQDASRMVTLLKVEATDLPVLEEVDKSELHVGQTVIALGRTFDLKYPNLSVGIISALNRVWGKAVQTDAKTSPVNYGGALIDLTGRCVGVIVPLSPQEQGVTAGVEWYDSGIGFAVPLADVHQVLDRLIAGESLKSGLLGVSFEDRGPLSDVAKVIRVRPESPADRAGIRVDDVITRLDGAAVDRLNDFKQAIGQRYAGDKITITVRRADETHELQAELAAELRAYVFPYLGILPQRRLLDEMEPPEGLGLRAVLPDSPAAIAGLTSEDRIVAVGSTAVANREDLAAQLRRLRPGDEIALQVRRGTAEREVKLMLGEAPNTPPLTVPPTAWERVRAGDDGPAVGRLNAALQNEGLKFWAYIPETYRPDVAWGLMVWLHPSGDSLEAETLRSFREICRQRSCLIVGPRAGDVAGWSPDQAGSLREVVEWMRERYQLDSQRIILVGRDDSADLTCKAGFEQRDLFRGVALLNAPLRAMPPDSNPETPLQVLMLAPVGASLDRLEKSVKLLQERKIPAHLELLNEDRPGFTPSAVDVIARWWDALDRL